MPDEQRRVAERILIEPQLEGVLGDNPGRIGEIATLGCRFEHLPRLAIGMTMPLRFLWEGQQIALSAKIVWSEFKFSASDKFYHSGLQFGDGDASAVTKVRTALDRHLARVIASLFPDLPLHPQSKVRAAAIPFMSTPFMSRGDSVKPSAPVPPGYLEVRWRNGRWDTTETPALSQPRDGFSFPRDFDPDEIALWQRCYQDANEPTRRMLRAALELRIG